LVSTVRNAIADLPTGRVFFRDSGGDGEAVVLLHAASGNSLLWDHQIAALNAAGYRVVAIDYRGVDGKPGAYDWSDQIDALVQHLDIERFHLLGTAAGGGTAFQYVLGYGAKVRSLIVANSHGNVTDKDYVDMGKRIRPSPRFDDLPLDFRELGPSYRAAHPEGVARWLELSGLRPGTEMATASAQDNSIAPARPDRFALRSERTVTWAKLAALQAPTLLITGDADLYMPPSVLRMFLERMTAAEWSIIPETGHSSYWENPEAFNAKVLAFLARHPGLPARPG
jgi:pimeloyl-ACP methyl ester carboxylesterase